MTISTFNKNVLKLIEGNFSGEKTLEALNIYSKKLIEKDLPIILSNEHLFTFLGYPSSVINNIIYSTEKFYRTFYIPKKNNRGLRKINAPNSILLEIQKKIQVEILSKISIHKKALGYVNGKTIKDNAIAHLCNPEILKVDIKDFFPSVNFKRVINVFIKMGYTRDISFSLARLCTLHNCLPQGAPTSPSLSNIILIRMDIRLENASNKLDVIYSRYADDLTFSSSDISLSFLNYVKSIIVSEGFQINLKKLRILKKTHKKIITGISITNDTLKVPREKKRYLRQKIYFIKKYGLINCLDHLDIFDPILLEKLLGYAYYWNFIEDCEASRMAIQSLKSELHKLKLNTAFLKYNLNFIK